ncbi:MAG: DUF1501 domain-containing protein [Bacteroidia bacterium]
MRRRDFIKGILPLGLTPLMINGIPVRAMANNLATQLTCSEVNDRVLVLIQLHGGNDGLNTIIPVDQYSSYRNYRPNLGIRDTGSRSYLNLTNTMGVHPDMVGFKSMFDNGMVRMVMDAGYDSMNRSHFKGNDLWLSGGDSTPNGQNAGSGWMGRYLNDRFQNYPSAYPNTLMPDPPALELGSNSISLNFHREAGAPIGLAMGDDAAGFYNLVSSVGGPLPASVPNSQYGNAMQYIMDVERSSNSYAQRINTAYTTGGNASSVTYPATYHSPSYDSAYNNELGPQLQTVARLIDGGLQTKVYMVRLTGFDTHSNQVANGDPAAGRHAILLHHLSESIKAFFDDITAKGHADRVMAVTFSEFGRQVGENGSRGTDHGSSAPMMIFGKHVEPGVLGTNPNLAATTGNIIPTKQHDYRQVFTTLLQDWLGAGPNSLTAARLDSFASSKLPLVNANQVVPATCYAAVFDVGLTGFDAVLELDGRVRVNWQTSTETNNNYFEVQQSADGAVYRTVERVDGAGTTEQLHTYLAFDPNPNPGLNYYRLKQVDYDGQYHYFDPVTLVVSQSEELQVEVSRYPNPATDIVNINITASAAESASLTLMNIEGKRILEDKVELKSGLNHRSFSVKGLRPGLYYIHLTAGKPGSYNYRKLATIKQVVQ